MGIISVKQHGSFNTTEKFLKRMREKRFYNKLQKYGQAGVDALLQATPKDTGKTAASWSYEVVYSDGAVSIRWNNSNLAEAGMPVAVLIQYGHATRGGTYVQGIDFINPALRPIFDEIANSVWKEVTAK